MRKLLVAALGAHLLLSGCAQPPRPQPQAESVWPAELSMEEVRALSPDECKAIMVARAWLESQAKRQVHAHFAVRRQGDDWIVDVTYTGASGQTLPPGSFAGVILRRDWTIKDFIGGA